MITKGTSPTNGYPRKLLEFVGLMGYTYVMDCNTGYTEISNSNIGCVLKLGWYTNSKELYEQFQTIKLEVFNGFPRFSKLMRVKIRDPKKNMGTLLTLAAIWVHLYSYLGLSIRCGELAFLLCFSFWN